MRHWQHQALRPCAHLADEVGALAEARRPGLRRLRLGLPNLQKGVGHSMHKLSDRARQLLDRV